MYLVDTNVVSELRRNRPHGAVLAWVQATPAAQLHISAFTVGELQSGIERTRAHDPQKADMLEQWLETLPLHFNVVSADAAVFLNWARLMQGQQAALYGDAIIAATAQIHSLTVATRNIRDFQRFNIPLLNPFAPLD